jgi:hypothetical protein
MHFRGCKVFTIIPEFTSLVVPGKVLVRQNLLI